MIEIKVPDMTCSHCSSTITKAVKDLDPAATVDISLPDHLVRVESKASKDALLHCIADAGYTPQSP
ncbi:MAG TPA: heavy-metal-associated domain-containing protein [Burkholderiales bacterium]|jgi:copper chaperone|nr:heavy-metal-associated domain-containing protein [Burkholderiales bacterium]